MDEQIPTIFIVMVNFQSWINTIESLESIFRSDYPKYSVIVVDNNSTDRSVEYIRNWACGAFDFWSAPGPMRSYSFPPVRKPISYLEIDVEDIEKATHASSLVLIRSKSNGGFSYGNNLGLRYVNKIKSSNDFIWMLNNDTVVSKDAMKRLAEYAAALKPQPFLVGNLVRSYYHPTQIDSQGWGYLDLISAKVAHKSIGWKSFKFIIGSSIFSKNILYWDENYFLYFEDVEYSKTAIRSGFHLDYCKESIIYHKIGASASQTIKTKGYKLQSMILFYKKNYPFLIPIVAGIRMIFYILLGRINNFKIILKALFINESFYNNPKIR